MAMKSDFNDQLDHFAIFEAFSGINSGYTIGQFNDEDMFYWWQAILAGVGAPGAVHFKGFIDASTNPNYPAGLIGDQWEISVKGKIGGASGIPVEAGDLIEANTTNAGGTQGAVGADWLITQFGLQQIFEITGSDLSFSVLRDLTESIGRDFSFSIVRDSINTVGRNFSLGVIADYGLTVGGNSTQSITGTWAVTSSKFNVTATGTLGVNVVPTASVHAVGLGATSATHVGKFLNSALAVIAYFRNDGFVGFGASVPSTAIAGDVFECANANGIVIPSGNLTMSRAGANYLFFNKNQLFNISAIDLGTLAQNVKFCVSATAGYITIGESADSSYAFSARLRIIESLAGIASNLVLANNQATAIGNASSLIFSCNNVAGNLVGAGDIVGIVINNANATFSSDILLRPVINNASLTVLRIKSTGTVNSPTLQTFANNAGAIGGGLIAGDWYLVVDAVTGSKIIEVVQ